MSDPHPQQRAEPDRATNGAPTNGTGGGPDAAAVARLRALLAVEPIDLDAASLEPLKPLPGLPFVLPGASALLSGPEGGGKSDIAQAGGLDIAQAGGRVLYIGLETSRDEWRDRALKILHARGLTDDPEARAAWQRITFTDDEELLQLAFEHPDAWQAVAFDFTLIVLDPMSLIGASLELDFVQSNPDWSTFHRRLIRPLQGRTAALMLDNVGNAENAQDRPLGAAQKRGNIDILLSSRARKRPRSLVITCRKARPTRAPFRLGDRWIAYEQSRQPAQPFDPEQVAAEQRAGDAPSSLYEQVRQGAPEIVLTEPGISRRELAPRFTDSTGKPVQANNRSFTRAIKQLIDDGILSDQRGLHPGPEHPEQAQSDFEEAASW